MNNSYIVHLNNSAKYEGYFFKVRLIKPQFDEMYERLSATERHNGFQQTKPHTSNIVKVINLAEFQLRKTIRTEPSNEKEIQDAFEDLLVGAGISYSRETGSIEYSSKTYIPDFTIDESNLAVEIKVSTKKEREKELIGEINDDILAYRTKYGNILFVIYDIGFIRDMERFAKNFESNEGVVVKVVKH